MSNETSKALRRRQATPIFHRAFRGTGIDIGCGDDPLRACDWPAMTAVEQFDRQHGDANLLDEIRPRGAYDWLHASQSLEHMIDPVDAFARWLELLRPGGFAVVSVPDFELYEQGVWPSRWNHDHKSRWSIERSDLGAASVCVLDFLQAFPVRVHLLQLCDQGYNYEVQGVDQTFTANAEAFIEWVVQAT